MHSGIKHALSPMQLGAHGMSPHGMHCLMLQTCMAARRAATLHGREREGVKCRLL